ncbi:MAG: hypothetical protein QHJ34_10575 [bacterium]|nr:hypothetical protein [candidate division KSB1 bacterium]MDH7560657.1 hypothetical protein [bacterium]
MSRNIFVIIFTASMLWLAPSCIRKVGVNDMHYVQERHIATAVTDLVGKYGEAQRQRIERGVRQVAQMWQQQDGPPEAFVAFCTEHFVGDTATLAQITERYERNFESIFGHFAEMGRELRRPLDLDIGPILPIDYLFAEFSPAAHLMEDLFQKRIALVALLNYPVFTLEERLALGPQWSRQQWAHARLVQTFSARVPAAINQRLSEAYVSADDYINHYNIFMHHVLTEDGKRLFPAGMKLISHWNLRDELKAQYANPEGLPRQRLIQRIMERIIMQEIPAVVINNPAVDWKPVSNTVAPAAVQDVEGATPPARVETTPEPDRRYEHLLKIFQAEREADPYYPTMPTLMDRRFQRDREIPEETVEALFKQVLASPEVARTARLIEKRLGRPLEPFDIWYNGFKPRSAYSEAELDRIVGKRYPNARAFEGDIPRILQKLGFSAEQARFLSERITVDPARGPGHAWEPGRRADQAHLRTRIPATGMNYKGYNIAIHELGHNCEQVFSLNKVDHTLLRGVPNTAFTEAFAFVFQARDLELLGLKQKDPLADHLRTLDNLWATYEIAGVALVDMRVWHWMYEHPNAKPAELKDATIAIAKEVWNEFYAPVFGQRDQLLLAIYSHMIDAGLYLPDYPLGHIIAFQIEQYLADKNLGQEMERMCRLGSITPEAWMRAAVGAPLSAQPLLEAAERALSVLAP